jgi:hypothetical protein
MNFFPREMSTFPAVYRRTLWKHPAQKCGADPPVRGTEADRGQLLKRLSSYNFKDRVIPTPSAAEA